MSVYIKNGLVYDGSGRKPCKKNIIIEAGKIKAVTEDVFPEEEFSAVIDAAGKWITPGFIDLHTHYDAEIEVDPGLGESTRHGVTTVTLGSCSLGLTPGTAEDLADMFSRVEAIPHSVVFPLLKEKMNWHSLADYAEHLDNLPLGPNVTSFVGHSAIRARVMGLERSLTKGEKPSHDELRKMQELLNEGLDAGYLGLSVNTLRWDKMDGSRFRSRPLPSTYANWSEYAFLNKSVRDRGRIFQGVPNVSTKINVLMFLWQSFPWFRPSLKTTVISLMDVRSNRLLYLLVGFLARVANSIFKTNFRLQALPEKFDLYADGVDVVVFEEFGAGTAAIHLSNLAERKKLLLEPKYRKWFRRQWTNWFLPRVFHRDFNQSKIVECPDSSLIGKSFEDIAGERGEHVVEVFLDLCAEFGNDIRWYTVIGNDRPGPLRYITSHPDVLIGFSDAGAHLRGMAHYNFPLRFLKFVHDQINEGKLFMTYEKAIWRLTGEIADWLGIDAGKIEKGKRADLVIINPKEFATNQVEEIHEAEIPGFNGYRRLVRRNDQLVDSVFINGKLAWHQGKLQKKASEKFGSFLSAK
jgi:N-acyl-D-aspartate/D-glutamate deacylase